MLAKLVTLINAKTGKMISSSSINILKCRDACIILLLHHLPRKGVGYRVPSASAVKAIHMFHSSVTPQVPGRVPEVAAIT
jgi:hypothetical protein